MTNNLIEAYNFFYKRGYKKAADIFIKNDLTYEAGLSYFLSGDLKKARKYFKIKEKNCPASSFCLILLDLIEDKKPKNPAYFQIRSFLEVILNFLIENERFSYAQKIINNYEFFTKINIETPKFLARVLSANNYNDSIPALAQYAKEICFYDAEIYFIEAEFYINQKDNNKALECINQCLSFAPEYYPVLKLKAKIESEG